MRFMQQTRAHHGRDRQRDDQRNGNRQRQRQREFAEQPADNAAHQQDRNNTATSEILIDSTVKPTSCAPRMAAFMRGTPFSICREIFSSTTMASSTRTPSRWSRHQREVIEREAASRYIAAKVPMIEIGTGHALESAFARPVAQEQEHDHHDQRHRDNQREFRIVQRRADRGRAIGGPA